MDRLFIVASLLLLLASVAAVEGRMVRSVFDDDKPASRSSAARLLTGPEDACQRTCDQVRFKAICRSLARLPGVSTPRQLLLASMRVAVQKAKEAKAKVDAYGARSHDGGPMASIISTCSKSYDDVAQSLEETRGLVEAQGTQFVGFNTKVSAATTFAGDCSTAFEDFPDIPSPFAAVQKNVFRVVDNVLNIADVVQQAEAHAHGPRPH
jgi:pectinesterase inhibitor-like protein